MLDPSLDVAHKNTTRYSVTKRHKNTKIPSPQERRTLPIHSSLVKPIRTEQLVEELLDDKTKQRWHAVWHETFGPILDPSSDVPTSPLLDQEQLDQLARDDIIESVSADMLRADPTKDGGFAYTVIEDRYNDEGDIVQRQRMIYWPRRRNDVLLQRYKPETHLFRISKYHAAIHEQAAITGDIKCGFYGIVIPTWARAWFRIVDRFGNVWQMTRLPMGIRTAVELMEIVTLAMIGHPAVCKPQHVVNNVVKHGFVDDFRVAGSVSDLMHAAQIIYNRCEVFDITLKAPLTIQTRYIFLGLLWNHEQRTVAIGTKTLRKIPTTIPHTMTFGDFQQLVSRLIYCAGALRCPLAPFYFALKWACRRCNDLNNGRYAPTDYLDMPDGVQHELDVWQAEIRGQHAFGPTSFAQRRHATLFTDASLYGWGAIIITADHKVFIAGSKWSRPFTSGDISRLEAAAVRNATRAFANVILEHGSVDFRIDNTSVTSAVRRGIARAPALNVALAGILKWLSRYDIVVTASYVKSDENLADPVSRGHPTPSLSREIVANVYERRGAGGILGA